jgi:hypothetical protein
MRSSITLPFIFTIQSSSGVCKHEAGKKLLAFMLCLLAICMQISVQKLYVAGVIINETKHPISGASFLMNSTVIGTTNLNGLFDFLVSSNSEDNLVISKVGFVHRDGKVRDYMLHEHVGAHAFILQTDSRNLEEVGNDTIQKYKPAQGKEVFSITISRNSQDVLKLDGGGTVFAATDKNKISILLKSTAGDPVSLYIFGATSGDYKFPEGPAKGGPKKGDAMFQLIPSSTAAKNEFKSGYVLSTGGIIHLTIENGTCSGNFEATVSFMNNGTISDIKYKAIGSFNNIPLKSKTN